MEKRIRTPLIGCLQHLTNLAADLLILRRVKPSGPVGHPTAIGVYLPRSNERHFNEQF